VTSLLLKEWLLKCLLAFWHRCHRQRSTMSCNIYMFCYMTWWASWSTF
jgi:hypothetical protein